ncbi:MAG: hypothetical protein OQK51_11040, partial [Kangiellaceae bacterium]|nr:hypothetical protein [Kangiellaceae bacterium]
GVQIIDALSITESSIDIGDDHLVVNDLTRSNIRRFDGEGNPQIIASIRAGSVTSEIFNWIIENGYRLELSLPIILASLELVFDIGGNEDCEDNCDAVPTITAPQITINGDFRLDGRKLALSSPTPILISGNAELLRNSELSTAKADGNRKIIYPLLLDVSGDMSIDVSSKIDVTGKGYPINFGAPDFSKAVNIGAHASAALHTNEQTSGSVGNYRETQHAGSGGNYVGCGSECEYNLSTMDEYRGGGLVDISANTLTLDGVISANGTEIDRADITIPSAGGSVTLNVNNMSGNGRIRAKGAWQYNNGVAIGSGGRIRIHTESSNSFVGEINTGEKVEDDGPVLVTNGTAFVSSGNSEFGNLIVGSINSESGGGCLECSFDSQTSTIYVQQVGEHAIQSIDSLPDNQWRVNVANANWVASSAESNGLVGIYVDLSSEDSDETLYRIIANTENTLTVQGDASPLVSGSTLVGVHVFQEIHLNNYAEIDFGYDLVKVNDLTQSSISSDAVLRVGKADLDLINWASTNGGKVIAKYLELGATTVNSSTQTIEAETLVFNGDVRIEAGGTLNLDVLNKVTIVGNLVLTDSSTVTSSKPNNAVLNIDATGVISIDETSNINLDGKGGAWAYNNSTACHAGVGSNSSDPSDCVSGNYLKAKFQGQGGNRSSGDGGGVISLIASQIVVDGSVSANGQNVYSSSSFYFGGAGGSIHIETPLLAGSSNGSIQVQGGYNTRGTGYHRSSAGRISIYSGLSTFQGTYQAGADNSTRNPSSSAGSIYVMDTDDTYGSLTFDNQGPRSRDWGTKTASIGTGLVECVNEVQSGLWRIGRGGACGTGANLNFQGGISEDTGISETHDFTLSESEALTFTVSGENDWGGPFTPLVKIYEAGNVTDENDGLANNIDYEGGCGLEGYGSFTAELPAGNYTAVVTADPSTLNCSESYSFNYQVTTGASGGSGERWKESAELGDGIVGRYIDLDNTNPGNAIYKVIEHVENALFISTTDDLSSYEGREFQGIQYLKTLSIINGASIDFGLDRLEVQDVDNSNFDSDSGIRIKSANQELIDKLNASGINLQYNSSGGGDGEKPKDEDFAPSFINESGSLNENARPSSQAQPGGLPDGKSPGEDDVPGDESLDNKVSYIHRNNFSYEQEFDLAV